MSVPWMFVLAGIGTYAIRALPIALVRSGLTVSPAVERTLRLIAPAVLAAIIVNSLVLDRTGFNTRISWFVGAAVAAFIMRRYRAAGCAMVLAMALVYLLQQAGVR
jgi:branched-subunit amino acid transport protein